MMIDVSKRLQGNKTEKQAEDKLEEFLYHNVLTNNAVADYVVFKHPSSHLHIQCKYSLLILEKWLANCLIANIYCWYNSVLLKMNLGL